MDLIHVPVEEVAIKSVIGGRRSKQKIHLAKSLREWRGEIWARGKCGAGEGRVWYTDSFHMWESLCRRCFPY